MPRAAANGIELEYEALGDGEPLVMIMGIGAQLVLWPEGLCSALVERGFRVIRFDSRDVGLSTKLHGATTPGLPALLALRLLGRPIDAPYTLIDMADDTAGLLDALGIERAHVLGVSLGGMVAQTMAIVHPSRVRSLVSLMSTPGSRRTSIGRPRALQALFGRTPRTRAEAVAHYVRFLRVCGSPAYPIDVAEATRASGVSFDRCHYPVGVLRQLAAVVATGDRTGALRFVRAPTLVIHGLEDPLLPPSGGRATARAIPGARLKLFPGMGHDLPAALWPAFADAVADNARRAGAVLSAP